MLYNSPLEGIAKTSSRTLKHFHTAGIATIQDLLELFPFRYEDYRTYVNIADLTGALLNKENDEEAENNLISKGKITIKGTIIKKNNVYARRLSLQKVTLADESGTTTLTWFNQPYLINMFKPGLELQVSGSIKEMHGFQPESYEIVIPERENVHTGRIVPVYSSVPGISGRTLREKMWIVVHTYKDEIEEVLPPEIVEKFAMPNIQRAFEQIHFPENLEILHEVRERMSFNELFTVQLKTKLVRKEWEEQTLEKVMGNAEAEKMVDACIKKLPFALTGAQQKTLKEIIADMKKTHPMNRLLQGDVGSGKTIVAAEAALFTHFHGQKTLYMAPTEILAHQQFLSFQKLSDIVDPAQKPTIALITSSSKTKDHDYENADIIIGTHALISSKRSFSDIGLVIVDEQHKFGVLQRGALKDKSLNAHMLSLTATPIPRTVLLTLYGELDISTIDEFPKGRKLIKTYVVPEHKRASSYEWIKKELLDGNQVFIVCPFIEQSEKETLQSVKAAAAEIKKMKEVFHEYSVELLHGRLKSAEKDDIMQGFSSGAYRVLVSTPVVEVGIDVPKATVIIIEGAERFGLAQLHQLRGRVGRSDLQSYCLLFSESTSEPALHRLQKFSKTHNGFELARYDLAHRGGGNMFGTQQHGFSSIALDTLLDPTFIDKVQKAAEIFISKHYKIQDFPYIAKKLSAFNIKNIAQN